MLWFLKLIKSMLCQVQDWDEWHKQFKDKHEKVEGEDHSGRCEENVQKVRGVLCN